MFGHLRLTVKWHSPTMMPPPSEPEFRLAARASCCRMIRHPSHSGRIRARRGHCGAVSILDRLPRAYWHILDAVIDHRRLKLKPILMIYARIQCGANNMQGYYELTAHIDRTSDDITSIRFECSYTKFSSSHDCARDSRSQDNSGLELVSAWMFMRLNWMTNA